MSALFRNEKKQSCGPLHLPTSPLGSNTSSLDWMWVSILDLSVPYEPRHNSHCGQIRTTQFNNSSGGFLLSFLFQHAICSYMTEVCGGCDLHLHICLFSTDTPAVEDNIPPRYASPRETAVMFKEITQAVSGRFHWFGETGATGIWVLLLNLPTPLLKTVLPPGGCDPQKNRSLYSGPQQLTGTKRVLDHWNRAQVSGVSIPVPVRLLPIGLK